MPSEIIFMSLVAFAAVFSLLTVLAVLMRIITALFPEPTPEPVKFEPARAALDPAVVAAITATLGRVYPGATVTHIEELK